MGLIRGGGLKIFLVVDHIPVEMFLPINYIFNATHTSNRTLLKDREAFAN